MSTVYKIIIIPEGSSLPEDLQHMFFAGHDIIEKIAAGAEKPVIIAVNTRELQMIVEYRDLFDAEPTAIIGMQGAMYNTVWNTYVATMERTTLDAFRTTLRDVNDESAREGSTAVARPTRQARVARLVSPAPASESEPPDASAYGAD